MNTLPPTDCQENFQVVFPAPGKAALESCSIDDSTDGIIRTRATAVSTGTEVGRCLGKLPGTTFAWFPGYSGVGDYLPGKSAANRLEPCRVYAHLRHTAFQRIPPNGIVLPVPDEVSDYEAAFITMASISLYGIRRGKIHPGQEVVIVGDGIIGQFAVWFARQTALKAPILVGHSPTRLKIAKKFVTSCRTINSKENRDVAGTVAALTSGEGAHVVIDCTAAASGFTQAVDCARSGGRVVVLGSKLETVEIPEFQQRVSLKELTIVSAHQPKNSLASQIVDRRLILELLAAKRLDIQPLITTCCPWSHAPELYRQLLDDKGEHLGVVFDWTEKKPASSQAMTPKRAADLQEIHEPALH